MAKGGFLTSLSLTVHVGFWFSTFYGVRLVCFTLSGLAVLDLSQAQILSSEKLENLLYQIAPVVFT